MKEEKTKKETDVRREIESIYRTDSRAVFATLTRLLGDFDLAEEAMQEAFATAAIQWEQQGIPANPKAWLVSTGRFKAIDAMRRRGRFHELSGEIADRYEQISQSNSSKATQDIQDDRLRLIFTCCHPAIDPKVQVSLTLREVCGLTTEQVAAAFLSSPTTMAQRIVRGKAKIREAGIPFTIPTAEDFPERLESVLAVIYLIFNEGYSASSGEQLMCSNLSGEAIRLGRLLVELLPDPEVMGLLSLMLFQESRRKARATEQGDIILLEDQDRSLWDSQMIAEGQRLVQRALSSRRFSTYTLQAAVASVHANASSPTATNWQQIVALYNALVSINPTPVVELNRAVAIAMRDGPEAGLALMDGILGRGELVEYHLIHAARADLFRRLGRMNDAQAAYQTALQFAKQEPEVRFLSGRLASLQKA